MKAFGKHILVKDIEENVVERDQEVLTEEEMKQEEETGIPTMQANLPPTSYARFVEVVSIGDEVTTLGSRIEVGMKLFIPHFAGDIIDEGIRVIGINSVLAIEE